MHYLARVLVRMRLGGVSNRSLRTVAHKSWEDYRALRANGVGGLGPWCGRISPNCRSLCSAEALVFAAGTTVILRRQSADRRNLDASDDEV